MSIGIAGLQKLTLLDYPGKVACTVFLGGCNLRCPFCHNASLVLPRGEAPLLREEEFFEFLGKRQGILDGVCVTGGEPLLYPSVGDFLARIRAMGYFVKLDTNGTLPERLEPLLAGHSADYVAMDIKNSLAGYEAAVGISVDTEKIVQSIALLRSSGVEHEFRTTVVKGIHTEEDVIAMARLVGDSPYFLQGFIDSGDLLSPRLSGYDKKETEDLLNIIRVYVKNAQIRG